MLKKLPRGMFPFIKSFTQMFMMRNVYDTFKK